MKTIKLIGRFYVILRNFARLFIKGIILDVICGQALYETEKVHFHHLIPRKDGSQYILENIALVHATRHETITYTRKD